MEATTLYRMFGEDGTLLYVGITKNPSGRFANHARRDWWHEVRQITLEPLADRASALIAESVAIATEAPRHNRAGTAYECSAATHPRRGAATPADADLISAGVAASVVGVHIDTVRSWADAGKLPCWTTPGGHRRFRRSDVLALLPDSDSPDAA